mmetsp:Transcript_20108/g.22777  ORF Transcript_20108/g.22777 Transcript_20108/m.22777 type:complete len:750 (-) Transcript_20108:906-3155(-)
MDSILHHEEDDYLNIHQQDLESCHNHQQQHQQYQQQQQQYQQQHQPLSSSFPPSPFSTLQVGSSTRKRNQAYSKYDVSRTMTRLRENLVGNESPIRAATVNSNSNNSNSNNSSNNNNQIEIKGVGNLTISLDQQNSSLLGTTSNDLLLERDEDEETEYHHCKQYDTFPSYDCDDISYDYNDQFSYDTDNENNDKDDTRPQDHHNMYMNMNKQQSKQTNIKIHSKSDLNKSSCCQRTKSVFSQIPAIALIVMFHLMIGIPFGVSYFPINWKESVMLSPTSGIDNMDDNGMMTNTTSTDDDGINGYFPIQGKNALGIRMFLFSTIISQIVFTFQSGFHNPIGLQMVENVPFCQTLAKITIQHCGYGLNALSTLFVMFGLSSILVGIVFYILGKLELGRIIYFFPSHVLVGLIAGIGIYLSKTGIEVTINDTFSIQNILSNPKYIHQLSFVVLFEIILRIFEKLNHVFGKDGKPKFSLLSPIYFCSITPVFYIALWVLNVQKETAEENGYFFPSLDNECTSHGCSSESSLSSLSSSSSSPSSSLISSSLSFLTSTFHQNGLFDIWTVIDFRNVSWGAIIESFPTLIALTIFSLIHVPINIPAFAISTNTEADMNQELIAHGYSNFISGCLGGLQNYMAYTQSVLYDRSGGYGKPSSIAVAIVTSILFFVGPTIASYIPRAMAGTLIVHVGIDLFLEGVYDTLGKFERLEYAGIWLIAIVMAMFGMDAAMIAGKVLLIHLKFFLAYAYCRAHL